MARLWRKPPTTEYLKGGDGTRHPVPDGDSMWMISTEETQGFCRCFFRLLACAHASVFVILNKIPLLILSASPGNGD